MGTRTASADPARLEAAAQAVPAELRSALATGPTALSEAISAFSGGGQSPPRITVSADELAGALARVVARSDELDTFLVRVAAEFRIAGSGLVGPGLPAGVLTLGDAFLTAQMARWASPQPVEFRVGADGTYEVLGPDGYWYTMATVPPAGAVPLGTTQQVVDLGNPNWGLMPWAGATIGITGGSTQPNARPAPPGAYDYVQFDENGNVVPASDVAGLNAAPRPPFGGDGGGWELVENGLSEANKYMSARYQNVLLTQTTFYVDPATGQRVAVVDAASISYDNGNNDAIITSGRLTTDEQGHPTIVATPTDYGAPDCTGAQERPTEIRVPVEAG